MVDQKANDIAGRNMENIVAKKPETALAVAETPSDTAVALAKESADFFGDYAGAGMENLTAKDMLIPRITILQALSPQLKKKDANYIEGAEVGDICDVATGEIFPQPMGFIPVAFNKVWLEWAPRASGKGLVAVHLTDAILRECELNDKNQPFHGPNLVSETSQIFGLNMAAGMRRCFISFTSTQIKKARKWMTLANGEVLRRSDGTMFTPPLFYRAYSISTVEESNSQGDWSGWKIEKGEILPTFPGWRDMMEMAVSFRDSILKGEVMADESTGAEPPAGPSNGEGVM